MEMDDLMKIDMNEYDLDSRVFTPNEYKFIGGIGSCEGSGNIYFGTELEVEFYSDVDRSNFLDEICMSQYAKWCYFTYDGSLKEPGLEIVTEPLTPMYQFIFWYHVLPIIQRHNATTSRRTGIHIHVSKDGIDVEQLVSYVYDNNRRDKIITIMGRKENRFCRFDSSKGKSSAINITDKTIEIRIFQSSIDLNKMFSYLAFVQTLTYMFYQQPRWYVDGVPVILLLDGIQLEIVFVSHAPHSQTVIECINEVTELDHDEFYTVYEKCRSEGGIVVIDMFSSPYVSSIHKVAPSCQSLPKPS